MKRLVFIDDDESELDAFLRIVGGKYEIIRARGFNVNATIVLGE